MSARYGYKHRQLREKWRHRVDRGVVACCHPRCGLPILPGEEWDLAHDPADSGRHIGPQHAACNRNTTLEKRLNGSRKGGFRWRSPEWMV
jgi:hypothetical protein